MNTASDDVPTQYSKMELIMRDGNASSVELVKKDEPARARRARLERERLGMVEPSITPEDALRIAEELFEPEIAAWYRRLGLNLAVTTHLRHYFVVVPTGVDGPNPYVLIDCYTGKAIAGPHMHI